MSDPSKKPPWKRPAIVWPVVVAAAAVFVLAMYLFQPWALFTDVEVNEDLPAVAATAPNDPAGPSADSATPAPAPAPKRTTLATGEFVSQAHPTSGSVKIIQLADGSRFLRFEGFQTDNGPDLKVWLSNNPAADADNARDGKWVNLGDLKGNIGNQNYRLPDKVDVAKYRSVLIWCDRFSVSFGAADLQRA